MESELEGADVEVEDQESEAVTRFRHLIKRPTQGGDLGPRVAVVNKRTGEGDSENRQEGRRKEREAREGRTHHSSLPNARRRTRFLSSSPWCRTISMRRLRKARW